MESPDTTYSNHIRFYPVRIPSSLEKKIEEGLGAGWVPNEMLEVWVRGAIPTHLGARRIREQAIRDIQDAAFRLLSRHYSPIAIVGELRAMMEHRGFQI